MKADTIGREVIRHINGIVNIAILTIVVLLVAFAGYALWDSKQIFNAADKSNYEIYKPTAENGGKSFKELQALNPEVIAWLSVYGTNIDYPVTQGADNMKYVDTNAEGLYSLSGAIFLDYQNSKDFSDFNSILYGHHMEKEKMFGEIGSFSDANIFDSHRYGNLYFDGENHGLEFFAFINADAYDRSVFTAAVEERDRKKYLKRLLTKARYKRAIDTTDPEHIVLLVTCSPASTNGREILVGRITDEVFDDPFLNAENGSDKGQMSAADRYGVLAVIILLPLILLLILAVRLIVHTRKSSRKRKRDTRDETA